MVEDELDKLGPSKDDAQSVLAQGHRLQAGVRDLFANLVQGILRLISGSETIIIDAVDGSETIPKASDVFDGYIDPGFVNYGADETGPATKETPVSVYEMAQHATFAQMFGSLSNDLSLSKLCFTQAQIKNFVKKHRNWLRTEGYGTFFLFKSKKNFFVAVVYVRSGGSLRVRVLRLECSYVWRAGGGHRLVVPQLAVA